MMKSCLRSLRVEIERRHIWDSLQEKKKGPDARAGPKLRFATARHFGNLEALLRDQLNMCLRHTPQFAILLNQDTAAGVASIN